VVAARVVQVAGRDERVPADALVVLGASQLDGRPGPVLEARLEHALELYRRAWRRGGDHRRQPGRRPLHRGRQRPDLAGRQRGPPDAVVAVEVGGNTLDSLVPVAALAQESGWQQGVLVVSDPWHVYRVRTMAGRPGPPVAGTSPTRTGPSTEVATREVTYVARETAAVLVQQAGLSVP
jgi:uncharacterized SAM-binding protein YcdF (DUF218 family)